MSSTLITDEQLWDLVEPIWSMMLGLAAKRDDSDAGGREVRGLAASVQIDGAFHGTVLFLPTEVFARRAAARMLAVPESSVGADDMDDAIGELCNILGGGVKNLVPAPSSLSLSKVWHGAPDVPDSRIPMAAGLRFACDGEPLELQILEAERYARVSTSPSRERIPCHACPIGR